MSSWLYVNDYHQNNDLDALIKHITQLNDCFNKLADIVEQHIVYKQPEDNSKIITKLDELTKRVDNLSNKIDLLEKIMLARDNDYLEKRFTDIDIKLDKIIQSNKSLIQYFNEIHTHDVRDLNYNIRSFYTKNNQIPPLNFIPERSKLN